MEFHIGLTRRGDLSVQIYRHIRDAVMDGRLMPRERLPPTREFARRLGVSRNTVSLAYELLEADGILVGRVGDGSFVSGDSVERSSPRRAPVGIVAPKPIWNSIPSPGARATTARAYDYDFGVGIPDATLFPFTQWRRLIAKELRPAAEHGRYQPPAGHTALRAAIARHIGVSRAVKAGADDVIVTQGAQQAFDLIGRVVLSQRTCVAIEEPGYPYARLLFESMGARVAGIPVDHEGLIVSAIPRDARLLYVTPSHQFPLGYSMSFERRMELLSWAERSGTLIIEDDYDSEFRFGGQPLDPLQTLDRTGCVIYVGSFSKVLLPTLRLGFLIAPASLRQALLAARQLTDWHSDLAKQIALANFIDRGLLAKQIRKLNREYSGRYARIADLLDQRFRNWLRPIRTASGIHVTTELHEGARIDIQSIVTDADEHGVRVQALASFCANEPRAGLVIGFGAIAAAGINEGMKRLEAGFRRTRK
jgi:GntR family transcriptional regulator/MocR family aminotransferase